LSSSFSSAEIIRRLEAAGFARISQKGSHLKLRSRRATVSRTVIVKHPAHDVPTGTFLSILRQAGLTREQFETL
jgi:predicted RNA binding protein YcfA (HicA-like mRNA interferase family)